MEVSRWNLARGVMSLPSACQTAVEMSSPGPVDREDEARLARLPGVVRRGRVGQVVLDVRQLGGVLQPVVGHVDRGHDVDGSDADPRRAQDPPGDLAVAIALRDSEKGLEVAGGVLPAQGDAVDVVDVVEAGRLEAVAQGERGHVAAVLDPDESLLLHVGEHAAVLDDRAAGVVTHVDTEDDHGASVWQSVPAETTGTHPANASPGAAPRRPARRAARVLWRRHFRARRAADRPLLAHSPEAFSTNFTDCAPDGDRRPLHDGLVASSGQYARPFEIQAASCR